MRSSPRLLHVHLTIRIGVKVLHNRRRKLARRNTPLKQDIEFSIRAALGLRKAEVAVDQAQEASAGPEKGRLRAPVPRSGIQHTGSDDVADDGGNVVEVSGKDNGLLTETRRGNFSDEAVADGTDGAVVCHSEYK